MGESDGLKQEGTLRHEKRPILERPGSPTFHRKQGNDQLATGDRRGITLKIKTITKALGAKFDRWVDTIEDKVVQDLVEKNTIITGGCITSMLLDEEVNDYDIYFSNKETVVAVAEYYTKLYKKENKDCPNLVVVSDTWDGRVSVLVPDVGVVGDEAEALMSARSPPPQESTPPFLSQGTPSHCLTTYSLFFASTGVHTKFMSTTTSCTVPTTGLHGTGK